MGGWVSKQRQAGGSGRRQRLQLVAPPARPLVAAAAASRAPGSPSAPKHLRFRLSLPSFRKAASSSLLKVALRRSATASSIGFVAPVSTTRLGPSTSSLLRASTVWGMAMTAAPTLGDCCYVMSGASRVPICLI